MKKFISLLLIFVMFLTSTIVVHSANSIPDELNYIDEFAILENNNSIISAMARVKDTTTIVTYNRNSNNVTMMIMELNNLTRIKDIVYKTDFNLELDLNDNFKITNVLEYEGETYYLSDLPTIDEYITSEDEYVTSGQAIGITIGVILGNDILNWIIVPEIKIVIKGTTYVVAGSVISNLQNNSQNNHFMASLRKGQLYIGDALTLSEASTRLRNKEDVWSISSYHARSVADPNAIGPENHYNNRPKNSRYFDHFHVSDRKGGHSFYGSGREGSR